MDIVVPGSPELLKRFSAIHRAIAASFDFNEALGLIAGCGVELVGADSCLVLLREEEEVLRICAAQGVDPAAAASFSGMMEESILANLRQYLGFGNLQSISAAPIMSDHVVRGILVVIRKTPLTTEETWLLSALAEQAAAALGNAFRHESMIARQTALQEEVERSRTLARELGAAIRSVAQTLGLDSGKGRDSAAGTGSGGRRMECLIQDLLAYSELAKADLKLESVDLQKAISEALAGLEEEIDRRGVLVRVESPHSRVLAHPGTLVRILGTLLSNAAQSARPGQKPLVTVKEERVGVFVRLSVRDNGRGIPVAGLKGIFGIFERKDGVEEYPGTGIGLALVQKAMERMGGRCGVESTLGEGSRFWIELLGA